MSTTYLIKIVVPFGVSDNMSDLITHVFCYITKETNG